MQSVKYAKDWGINKMSFDELLFRAKAGDMDAKAEIFAMYRPLLIKYSLVNRRFDEDLYQELAVELMKCIRYFRDVEELRRDRAV